MEAMALVAGPQLHYRSPDDDSWLPYHDPEGMSASLLTQAIWWVDAAAAQSDRLVDISGAGRDAVFGAGAAAPVVLPHTGEDYIASLGNASNANQLVMTGVIPLTSVITFDAVIPTVAANVYAVYATAANNVQIYIGSGALIVRFYDAAVAQAAKTWTGVIPNGVRCKVEIRLTATTAQVFVDGVDKGVQTIGITRTAAPVQQFNPFLGGAAGPSCSLYQWAVDDAYIMIPSNHHTNYTKITNTGTAGGDWTITRAATGYKAAVVDRPLLLFGGGQYMNTAFPGLPRGTVIQAWRQFSDTIAQTMMVGKAAATSTPGIYVYRDAGTSNIVAIVYSDSGNDKVSVSSPFGQFTHASRLGGAAFDAFLNGALAGTDAALTAGAMLVGSAVYIGRASSGGSSYAGGEFIAAAIFDRALTDAEVAQASQELVNFGELPWLTRAEGDSRYVNESGDTMTGDLTISKVTPTIILDTAAEGQHRIVQSRTAGKQRWSLRFGDNQPESGGNTGSRLLLYAYADDGNTITATVLKVERVNGLVTVAGNPTDPLGIATKQYVDARQPIQKWSFTVAAATWYRIAVNGPMVNGGTGGDRAAGQFRVYDQTGGKHGYCEFIASASYGATSLSLLHTDNYSGAPVVTKVRIMDADTYAGAAVEVYASVAGTVLVEFLDTDWSSGWVPITTATAGSVPAGFTARELDVVNNVSGEIGKTGAVTVGHNGAFSLSGPDLALILSSQTNYSAIQLAASGSDVVLYSLGNELSVSNAAWNLYRRVNVGWPVNADNATSKAYVDARTRSGVRVGTTDASGDLVITYGVTIAGTITIIAGLGDLTPGVVGVVVLVDSVTSTNFKVRAIGTNGQAVAGAAIRVNYHAYVN